MFFSVHAWTEEQSQQLKKMGLTIDSRKAVFKHVSELQAKVKYDQWNWIWQSNATIHLEILNISNFLN